MQTMQCKQRFRYFLRYLEVCEIFKKFKKMLGHLEKCIAFWLFFGFSSLFSSQNTQFYRNTHDRHNSCLTHQRQNFKHNLYPCCFESCFISMILGQMISDILFCSRWEKVWPKGFKIAIFLKQQYEKFRDAERIFRHIKGIFCNTLTFF